MATGEIAIAATPAEIMDVLADVPGMLEWAPAQSVTVLEHDSAGRPTRARWRENHGPLRDEFVLQYDWDGAGVSWRLIEGRILKKEDGRYTVRAGPAGGTEVTYSLELGIGVWVLPSIRSWLELKIVTGTLASLKGRLEGAR